MVVINVCIGTSCHLNGSYNIVQIFQQLIEEYSLHEKIDFKAIFCAKQCQNKGVSVTIDGEAYRIGPEDVRELFQNTVLSKI
jgi:NADH:ubiquinone oxidoreductase subunit E